MRQPAPADERHDLDDEFARVDLVQLQVVVLGDQSRDVALQSGDVDVCAASAHFEQHVDRGGAVLLDDRDEQVGDLVARRRRSGTRTGRSR